MGPSSILSSFARYVPTGHLVFSREGRLFAAPLDLGRRALTAHAAPVLQGIRVEDTYGAAQFAFSDEGTLVFIPGTGSGPLSLLWVDTGRREL